MKCRVKVFDCSCGLIPLFSQLFANVNPAAVLITTKGDSSHCVTFASSSNNQDEIVSCVAGTLRELQFLPIAVLG